MDWPRCEKFVEEVNKVPEQELKCWSQDGNCDPLKTSGVYGDRDGMLALIASLKVVAESAEKAYEEDAAAKDEDESIRWLLNQVPQHIAATSKGSTNCIGKAAGLAAAIDSSAVCVEQLLWW